MSTGKFPTPEFNLSDGQALYLANCLLAQFHVGVMPDGEIISGPQAVAFVAAMGAIDPTLPREPGEICFEMSMPPADKNVKHRNDRRRLGAFLAEIGMVLIENNLDPKPKAQS